MELLKYGVSDSLYVVLRETGSLSARVNPTLASGDVKISKDGGAFANLATLPTVTPSGGVQVKITLSVAELQCKQAVIRFADQTSPSQWDEQYLSVHTYGNTSAQHPFDLGADLSGNNVDWKFKSIDVRNSSGVGLHVEGGSNNAGINVVGAGTGVGMKITGGATGHGIQALGGSTTGAGIAAEGVGTGEGIIANGKDSRAGIKAMSTSGNQYGVEIVGSGIGGGLYCKGGSNGTGIHSEGGTVGRGINILSNGAGNAGIFVAAVDGGPGIDISSLTGSYDGIKITGSGSGNGLKINGGSVSGPGMAISAGDNASAAVLISGGSISGKGVLVSSSGIALDISSSDNDCVSISSASTGSHCGLRVKGWDNAAVIESVNTSVGLEGNGLKIIGKVNGNGVLVSGSGTGRDIRAKEIGAVFTIDGVSNAGVLEVLKKVVDDNGGADYDATTDSLQKISGSVDSIDISGIDAKIDIIDTNVDTVLLNQSTIDGKIDTVDTNVDATLAGVILINSNVNTVLINQGTIDGKIDALEDISVNDILTATIDADVNLLEALKNSSARVVNKYELNVPAQGQMTLYGRNNATVLAVMEITDSGRTRIS